MKKLSLSLITLVLVAACSPSSNKELSVAREGSPPNQVVEYVWHYKDTNFSEENLNMLIDKWNSMTDSRDYEMNGANILFPRGESTADFIWVMLWPSMEARDAAWDDWMNNLDEDWQNLINGIMKVDFDNVYAFKPTVKRTASVPNQSSYFENEFNFCNYNEGYGVNDLQQFETNFNTFLDGTELRDGPDGYWYVMLEPYFEGSEENPLADYVWLSLWTDIDEKNRGYANYANTSLPAEGNTFSNCERYSFSGRAIR